jgi:hypothetical protein
MPSPRAGNDRPLAQSNPVHAAGGAGVGVGVGAMVGDGEALAVGATVGDSSGRVGLGSGAGVPGLGEAEPMPNRPLGPKRMAVATTAMSTTATSDTDSGVLNVRRRPVGARSAASAVR